MMGPASAIQGWRRYAACMLLVVLPVALALCAYYPRQLAGEPLPRPEGDAAFYAYQLARAAECHGQWWRIARDERLGAPYPTEFAKHPGLYEGVELMLCATLIERVFGAAATYHIAVLAVLAVNGWIAAWIVLRATRSVWWAALATSLITLNHSIAVRILGHLHLLKFGWAILAVWIFALFLKRPTWRRGVVLGLAAAFMLQGSFYLGFFLALGLGFCYLCAAVAGRLPAGSFAATVAAFAAFVVTGGLLCFPVWTGTSRIVASCQYFHRDWSEVWAYGSELWKYLVPRGSALANTYYRDIRFKATPPLMDEGWNFPGYTVLLGALVWVVARLRGAPLAQPGQAFSRRAGIVRGRGPGEEFTSEVSGFVPLCLGLMAFFTVLSLSGGPAVLIYHAVPSFRCYGRAGLLVVALGSVVAPIILCELARRRLRPRARVLLTLVIFAVAISDARFAVTSSPRWRSNAETPHWVTWLKDQPADVRLAAFVKPGNSPFDWWAQAALKWLPLHGHATLNGADFALFEGDLQLLGASYIRMSPAGLRFVVSLGYEALAFHRSYLDANPWIESVDWLDRVAAQGEWLIARANPRLTRLPARSLEHVLAQARGEPRVREAPPRCWITDSWPVSEDLIVTGSECAFLRWTDATGRPVSQRQVGLYQRVFGPGLPAYTVRTPASPGSYQLVIEDRDLRPVVVIGYQLVPRLEVAQPTFPARPSGLTVDPVTLTLAGSDRQSVVSLTLMNAAAQYVQSRPFREFLDPVAQVHPGMRSRWPKANAGALVLRVAPLGTGAPEADEFWELPLPEDIPPGGSLRVKLRSDRFPASWAGQTLRVQPAFAGLSPLPESPQRADIKLSLRLQPPGNTR
jgi:hypothetical protein